MAERTVTVKSSGGDYTSLNAALSGESTDLVTNTRLLTIETYAFEDTTDADTGTGYTVNSSYYIKITSPESERHAGVWSDSKARHKTAGGAASYALNIQEAYTIVEWQQFDVVPNTDSSDNCGVFGSGLSNVTIRHCIFRRSGSYDGAAYVYGIYNEVNGTYPTSIGCKIYRNIFYDFYSALAPSSPYEVGLWLSVSALATDMTIELYNNTAFNCGIGILFYGSGVDDYLTVTMKNNFCGGCNSADFAQAFTPYSLTSAKNISSDSSSPDGASYRGKTDYSDYFVDYTSKDFHLKSTDTVLKDAGDNLGSPYDIDIDGQTVSGTWDIGADEYVSVAATLIQHSFRFINDDGDEDESTFNAALNTAVTLAADSKIRLRYLIDATGNPDSKQFEIQYRYKPSGGSFGDWTTVQEDH